MNNMIKMHLEGEAELDRKLQGMAEMVGPKKTTYILADAARIVAKAIKALAPKGPTGNLRRSPYSKGLPVKSYLPAVALAAISGRVAPHAHLVEFGSKPRFDSKHSNRFTGVMPASPFFIPAWQSKQSQVRAYIERRLEMAWQKVINK
jgi:hypothetical protein